MPVSCHEFLNSAVQLVEGASEIDYRNAVSRAHYAAYHACKSVVHCCPVVKAENMGHHEFLALQFQKYPKEKSGHKAAHKIAWLMNQTRLARGRADYDIGNSFKQGYARTQVGNAKRIIDLTIEFSTKEAAPAATPTASPAPASDDKSG